MLKVNWKSHIAEKKIKLEEEKKCGMRNRGGEDEMWEEKSRQTEQLNEENSEKIGRKKYADGKRSKTRRRKEVLGREIEAAEETKE